MVIESRYWREDLVRVSKLLRPVVKPPRWSERRVVNFEKEITIGLFMVRRLAESGKFSSRMMTHKARLFRCAFRGESHRLIYKDIVELYELEVEEEIWRDVIFVCNQFIHADFTYAFRNEYRNWEGIYVSSDFQKRKWIYRIPVSEIKRIFEIAVVDRPSYIMLRYDASTESWIRETD